jgi:tripartite-type tricarboxylate transporter receptor subunit TctC
MAQALHNGSIMAIAETPAVATASNLPILAALSETRLRELPDVPTMKELGHPANSFTAGGMIAPANMPPAAAATLENACEEAAAAPEYKAIAARLKIEPRYLPGAGFRKLFEVDSLDNADAIKRMGLGSK